MAASAGLMATAWVRMTSSLVVGGVYGAGDTVRVGDCLAGSQAARLGGGMLGGFGRWGESLVSFVGFGVVGRTWRESGLKTGTGVLLEGLGCSRDCYRKLMSLCARSLISDFMAPLRYGRYCRYRPYHRASVAGAVSDAHAPRLHKGPWVYNAEGKVLLHNIWKT